MHIACGIESEDAAAANLTRLFVAELSSAKDVSILP